MHKLKKPTAILSLLLFLAIAASAQPRMFPLASLKTDPVETTNEGSDPLSEFPEKGLPEASIIAEQPSFQAGAAAARQIMKFEDDALPMLIAALQKGGFYVIDLKGKILYMPRSGPGLDTSFYDFEVAGMLRGVGLGVGTSLERMAERLAGDGSGTPKNEIARRLLADIRAMRQSPDPHVQFNAGMIYEFSRLSPGNGDLAAGQPSSIKFNSIQSAIIFRILLRDMMAKFTLLSGGNAMLFKRDLQQMGSPPRFVNASWEPLPVLRRCEAIGDAATLEKFAKNSQKVYEAVKVYRELSKDMDTVDKMRSSQEVSKMGMLNAALTWAKLVMALMNLEATFDIEEPMPLIRTKKSGNNVGERRNVTIKARIAFANSDLINCAGSVLKLAFKVDFGVPTGGPVKEAPVKWEVVLSGTGTARYTSVPTMVDAANRGDISRQFTDAKGENTVVLTGKPQPEDLTGQPVVPLPKSVRLRAQVALEKMDAANDIPKILQLGLSPYIDPLSIIEAVADVVAKIPLKTFTVTVPVRDWIPCSADWGGVVEYKRELTRSIVVRGNRLGNGNSTGDGLRQISELDRATITLNPRTKSEIEAGAEKKPATIFARGDHSDIFSGKREGDPCCGPAEGNYTTTFRSGKRMIYSETFTQPVDVNFSATARDFRFGFNFTSILIPTLEREFTEIDDTNCLLEKSEAGERSERGSHMLMGRIDSGRHGSRYFDESGEILVGTKNETAEDGAKITWTWQLARCGKGE